MNNLKELEQNIPQNKSDIQVGPLSIWVSDVVYNDKGVDFTILNISILLTMPKFIAFSSQSNIEINELKKLLNDLMEMYSNINSKEIVLESSFSESEVNFKMISNLQGQINLEFFYHPLSYLDNNQFNLKDKIDQTYLPPIISQLELIIKKYQ